MAEITGTPFWLGDLLKEDNIMKHRILSYIAIIVIIFAITACNNVNNKVDFPAELETVAQEKVCVAESDSWLSDFYVLNGEAYIKCIITVECSEATEIQLYGYFPKDEGKLLKEALLLGQFGDSTDSLRGTAELPTGTTELHVYFIGDFAGTNQKQDRLLPLLYFVEV